MRHIKSPSKRSHGKFVDAESSLDIDMAKSQVPSEQTRKFSNRPSEINVM